MINIDGLFWLADTPDRRIRGSLNHETCELSLIDHLVSPMVPYGDDFSSCIERQDAEVRYRIHGELDSGTSVTLPSAVRAITTDDDQTFSDLRILDGWPSGDFDAATTEGLTLTFAPALTHWLKLSSGVSLALELHDAPDMRLEVTAEGALSFTGVPSWTPLQCERRLVMPIVALHALLLFQPMTSPWCRRYVVGPSAAGEVRVWRRVIEHQQANPSHHSVATYRHVDASSWVRGWLELTSDLAPSYATAISAMFEPAPVQGKIFGMASALERFHDERVKLSLYPDLSTSQITKHRRAAVRSVPPELQQQVRELLRPLGTPSFQQGLVAVISRLPKGWAEDLAGPVGDGRNRWLKAVKDVRNGTAHAGAGEGPGDDFEAYVARLSALSESLIFVTATCYLEEAGLPPDKVERGLRDMSRFHLARNRLKLSWPEIYK